MNSSESQLQSNPNPFTFLCRCKSFGCIRERAGNEDDPEHIVFGRYLGSAGELRRHSNEDKKRRRLNEFTTLNAVDVDIIMETGTTAENESGYSGRSRAAHTSQNAGMQLATTRYTMSYTSSSTISQSQDSCGDLIATTSAQDDRNHRSEIEAKRRSISNILDTWRLIFEQHKVPDVSVLGLLDNANVSDGTRAIRSNSYIDGVAHAFTYERILEKMIDNIENIKTYDLEEFDRQKAQLSLSVKTEVQRVRSMHSTDAFVDTSIYSRDSRNLKELDPIVLGCLILSAILHLECGVSMDGCSFALRAISCILQLSFSVQSDTPRILGEYQNIVDSIPNDIRTVIRILRLQPAVNTLACCPKCYACYRVEECPPRCTYQKAPKSAKSDICNRTLLKKHTSQDKDVPVKEYHYHDLKQWIGELLWRPGMEELLDRDVFSDYPGTSEPRRDIWHGKVMKEFIGPDGLPYIGKYGKEIRLVFSISMDGFNPFRNKQAGKKVSVSAIYLICQSLPPDIRQNSENIFFAAVIPGPNHPSLDQINHMLRPIIDSLLQFWETGYYYSETPSNPEGRLVRCVIIPLVCDLPAARQMSGFVSHSSKRFFCSFCYLSMNDIDNLAYDTWEERSNEKHRQHAEAWEKAQTETEKETILQKHGVRHSEILRLPYYNMPRFTILDPMHSLFLGNLHRHCAVVLGMDPSLMDGSGEHNRAGRGAKLVASPTLVEKALRTLRQGTLDELRQYEVVVLKEVAHQVKLRFSGDKIQILKLLKEYRIKQKWFDEDGNKLTELPPDIQNDLSDIGVNPLTKEQLAAAEDFVNVAASTQKILEKFSKTALVGVCMAKSPNERRRKFERMTKQKLAEMLENWRILNNIADQTGNVINLDLKRIASAEIGLEKDGKTKVLGRERLREVWLDMNGCVLPSWLSPAPRNTGDGMHGKLTADQWRTFCTVHLVITLIWLWGHLPAEDRLKKILINFMHLVTATKMATMRSITNERIQAFRDNILLYLQGVIELFPGVGLSPNQHLSVHLTKMLEDFGPTHSWWAYSMERSNFLLQQTSTNRKFGDIEKTMLDRFCNAQKLRYMMKAQWIPSQLDKLVDSFESFFHTDKRGTLLNDITALRSAQTVHDITSNMHNKKAKKLDDVLKLLLEEYVKKNFPEDYHDGVQPVRPWAVFVNTFDVNGVTYKSTKISTKDCYVTIGDLRNNWFANRVEEIFIHTRDPRKYETVVAYFILRKYKILRADDIIHDYYRQFSVAGGRLFYDEFEDGVELFAASEIVCHFALTPYNAINNEIKRRCIHALPLDRD